MGRIGETTLEIDLSALEHNFRFLKSKLRPQTMFLGVVKAFAYGSDMVAIAKQLESMGADYLAVAYTKEGVLLREAGITIPILVLHPQPFNFQELMERCLEPSLYSPKVLRLFLEAARKAKQKAYPVHIKFNTGLNRLGFWENDIDFVLKELGESGTIKIKGAFSHLAASEDENELDFTRTQIATFNKIGVELREKLGYGPIYHILNTSGILNHPDAQLDMVRSGIGLYGFGNHRNFDYELKPVACLKTVISQRHKIEPGESVGYNRGHVSNRYAITATLPLGHADGIARQYGGGTTFVSIKGKKAPIIGNVCMDMIMVDVTEIDCKEGDEVIIFGPENSAKDFANSGNTISYEILTAVSQRVTRKIKK